MLLCGFECELYLKLELLQKTGTFKPRGVLTVMSSLSNEQLNKGVTAVSAGNHAIAVAYGAQLFGSSAKVVMPKTANSFRVKRCEELGAEVILCQDIQEAFKTVQRIQDEEQRYFVHPFDGPLVALGTATLGVEFVQQAPTMEIAVISIGGGGLAAGAGSAIKQMLPKCRIFGVEPEGANTMYRSFQSGKPETISKINTIADSLGAPSTMQYSFSVCRTFLESIVTVSDEQLARAMALMFERLKLVAEPAAAAALAAVCGPLREQVEGKKVGIVICGSNIDFQTFSSILAQHGLSKSYIALENKT
ncbi:threonine ammonia-lyase [Candidatus Contendibacter odensensis]|nr:pyridoxal-phosphate dependent enzyme [Candidatus Contendobacter odensis]